VSAINVAQAAVSQGMRRSQAWDISLIMPGSPPPTSSRTCRSGALGRAGCYRVFTKTAGGAAAPRPALDQVLGMGQLLGYARVSTGDQQSHLQVDVLERAGCHQVLTETASAASADRPVLGQVLDQLRPAMQCDGRLASGVLVSPEARRPRARQRRRSP
jgi:hypothetical protein